MCAQEQTILALTFAKVRVKTDHFEGSRIKLQPCHSAPNVCGIGLEDAGVEFDTRNGVHINEFYQSANPDIYASGDGRSCVVIPYCFLHGVLTLPVAELDLPQKSLSTFEALLLP
jgi:hypothetical protein